MASSGHCRPARQGVVSPRERRPLLRNCARCLAVARPQPELLQPPFVITMRLTQQQLETRLWGAANILRGKTAGRDGTNCLTELDDLAAQINTECVR